MTWSHSELMWAMSDSEMSVPMEMTAAAFNVASKSSGRMEAKSVEAAFVRKPAQDVSTNAYTDCDCLDHSPIALITFAYAMLSTMIFAISGKCQPYHSCKEHVNVTNY